MTGFAQTLLAQLSIVRGALRNACHQSRREEPNKEQKRSLSHQTDEDEDAQRGPKASQSHTGAKGRGSAWSRWGGQGGHEEQLGHDPPNRPPISDQHPARTEHD